MKNQAADCVFVVYGAIKYIAFIFPLSSPAFSRPPERKGAFHLTSDGDCGIHLGSMVFEIPHTNPSFPRMRESRARINSVIVTPKKCGVC